MAVPAGGGGPPAVGGGRTSASHILILYPAEYSGIGGVVKGDPGGTRPGGRIWYLESRISWERASGWADGMQEVVRLEGPKGPKGPKRRMGFVGLAGDGGRAAGLNGT